MSCNDNTTRTAAKRPPDGVIAEAVLFSRSYAEAARKLRCSQRTLWNWRQDESYQTAERRLAEQIERSCVIAMQQAVHQALDALLQLATTATEEAIRQRAAATILSRVAEIVVAGRQAPQPEQHTEVEFE